MPGRAITGWRGSPPRGQGVASRRATSTRRSPFARTVDGVIGRLGHGRLVYRDKNDGGLPGHEGTFLPCAFWFVDALLWLDREDEARLRFEALRAIKNDVGLYSEAAAEDRTFLGNVPQAISHLGFIHRAPLLDLYEPGDRTAVQDTGTSHDGALDQSAVPPVNSLNMDKL